MRLTRLTISLLVAGAILGAPAAAAAQQTFQIKPASGTTVRAGGHPTYTTNIGLDQGAGGAAKVTIRLMPGVLASPAANPSCVKGSPQYTSACQIGTGSVSVLGALPVPVSAYLVPPPSSSDIVGIDLVPLGISGLPTSHAGAKLVQTAKGNVQTVLSVNLKSSLGGLAASITGMSLTVNGTLNGNPFNRMPTNCSPGHSTVTVAYANKTETSTASPDFKPTGCAALPYAPKFSATAHQDAHDPGAAVVTTVAQAIGQAATAHMTMQLPKSTLGANFNVVGLLNSGKPVGSAVASSPLLPNPLKGKIFLVGAALHSRLKIIFPPPAALTLTGLVSLTKDSVTIPAVPDVPLTSLVVSFPGGRNSLLAGACLVPTGRAKVTFTGQNGKTVIDRKTLKLSGCPSKSG